MSKNFVTIKEIIQLSSIFYNDQGWLMELFRHFFLEILESVERIIERELLHKGNLNFTQTLFSFQSIIDLLFKL